MSSKYTVQEIIESNNYSRAISYYLMSSYLYYAQDMNVLSDYDYDMLCRFLRDNFRKAKKCGHPHTKLLIKDNLDAGTFIYKGRLPASMVAASRNWVEADGQKTGREIWQCSL